MNVKNVICSVRNAKDKQVLYQVVKLIMVQMETRVNALLAVKHSSTCYTTTQVTIGETVMLHVMPKLTSSSRKHGLKHQSVENVKILATPARVVLQVKLTVIQIDILMVKLVLISAHLATKMVFSQSIKMTLTIKRLILLKSRVLQEMSNRLCQITKKRRLQNYLGNSQ